MREYIEKISKGIFEYDTAQVLFSDSKMVFDVPAGDKKKVVLKMSSVNDKMIKGFVYTYDHRMQCLTPQFSSTSELISFEFDSTGLAVGDVSDGIVSIICSAGEYDIRYSATVVKKALEPEKAGDAEDFEAEEFEEISTLEEFAKFEEEALEEAFSMFSSRDFRYLLDTPQEKFVYESLTAREFTVANMEEFLIALDLKKRTRFAPVQDILELKGQDEEFREIIKIVRDTFGYIEIKLSVDNDFVKLPVDSIDENDFVGSYYELELFIDVNKLHMGNNYARIKLESSYNKAECIVKVHKEQNTGNLTLEYLETKSHFVDMLELFYKMRLDGMPASVWARESEPHISRICTIKDDMFLELIKALMFICEGKNQEANWIIDKARANKELRATDPKSYGLLLYLSVLLEKEPIYVAKIKDELEGLKKDYPDEWMYRYLLFYVDEKYRDNYIDKYLILKELLKTNSSTILLAEAASIIKTSPTMLSSLEGPELRIVSFLMKYRLITKSLSIQIMELVSRLKTFNRRIYRVAEHCALCFPTRDNIEIICGYLIRGGVYGAAYKQWFLAGIQYDLRITRLYEYFMLSAQNDMKEPLPKIVFLYFRYNTNLDNKMKSYLYANLIKYRSQYPEVYESYEKAIYAFMLDQMFKGLINDNLAVIYDELFSGQVIASEHIKPLVNIISTHQIVCENEHIEKVMVCYKKLRILDVFSFNNFKAFVNIWSDDYMLIFIDKEGRYYTKDIDYTIKRFINDRKYVKRFATLLPNDARAIVKYLESDDVSLDIERRNELKAGLLSMEEIKEDYKKELLIELTDYYYENPQEIPIATFDNVNLKLLSKDSVLKLRYIYIKSGNFERGYDLICKYGYENIECIDLVGLCDYMTDLYADRMDESLLKLSWYLFDNHKYTENILKYLGEYFNGGVKMLKRIQISMDNFNLDTAGIRERIIIQTLFARVYVPDIGDIFADYYRMGPKTAVKDAFFAYYSYGFVVKEQVVSDRVLEYIKREYLQNEELLDICRLAVLKYLSMSDEYALDDKEKGIIKELLKDYVFENVRLAFFADLPKEYLMEYGLENVKFIECRDDENAKLEIRYTKDGENYITEDINRVIYGIFVKEAVVFAGESLQYYITKVTKEGETILESGEVILEDDDMDSDGSDFGDLNDMMLSYGLKDEKTLEMLMKSYEKKKYLVDRLFTLK